VTANALLGPPLRLYLRGYRDYAETSAGTVHRREMPHGGIVLILGLGDELGITDPRQPRAGTVRVSSFVAGLYDSYVVTSSRGLSSGIQLSLDPVGAHLILGVPMAEVANRIVPLPDLLGRSADTLAERLAGTSDPAGRAAIVDGFLHRRLASARPAAPQVVHAWRRLVQTHGGTGVAALADELGWSRRHLVGRFREQVGLPPKTVARILRFERAYGYAGRPGVSWARVAYECGYADQAHLIREFREFTGATPGEVAAVREWIEPA
jgi:AraC-like DNA-binding protein